MGAEKFMKRAQSKSQAFMEPNYVPNEILNGTIYQNEDTNVTMETFYAVVENVWEINKSVQLQESS